MGASSRRIGRAFWFGATAAAVAVLTVAAVTISAVGAAPKPSHSQIGPGYPPPGGIYTLFTNCPLNNPLMHESVTFASCVAGYATSGSIKIGNITTPVVRPVNVQFGFWTGPNQNYYADAVPPIAGLSAILSTKPDLIPEPLTTMLGCPSTNKVVENLCQQAKFYGGKYLDVYALAQEDGAITNFDLLNWTQPVMFKLINPLLGSTCSIGTIGNPVVLNPSLTLGSGGVETDPNPAKHPDTQVLATQSTASDNTFSAPGITGCGPGGVKNIPVDEALNASAGLPAASGVNSLTLTGTFDVGFCSASTDSSLPQPQDDAKILLSAFAASVGTPPASRSQAVAHRISAAKVHKLLRHLGIR
jgi:hypothetical protein